MERYPRQTMPTATNTPTMISNFAFSIPILAGCSKHEPAADGAPASRNDASHTEFPDPAWWRLTASMSWAHGPDRNKLLNLRIRRTLKFLRRRHERNPTVLQHGHPIGDREDFWNLVTDHHPRKAEFPLGR